MKSKAFLTLLSAGHLISCAIAQASHRLEPTYTNDSYKNIAFFAAFGGSSHYNWVLNIGNELGARGHNVSFLTSDQDARFGRPYINVKTVPIGPGVKIDHSLLTGKSLLESLGSTRFMAWGMELMFEHFEHDYEFAKEYFINYNIDLAMCDHFAEACIEAATTLNIPYIVTTAVDILKDSSAPYINNDILMLDDYTTEYQSFHERFMNHIVKPVTNMRVMWPYLKRMNDRKKAIGIQSKIQDPSERWKDSLKLVNTMFGFSEPRPLGPLVEYVGPIISQHYTPLNNELQEYLDAHKNVAYIAFGQHAVPSEDDIKLILNGLLETVEDGLLDGFIWATVHAAGLFPDSITTSSNTTYNIQDLFNNNNPNIRFVKWAPQTAILLHPSTSLFVSHGGLGSWYESMYSGTRMIMFPFFGDQPANSMMIDHHGLGAILKSEYTIEQAVELFKRIATDKDGEIMRNVKRIQALTQIHSKHSVLKGADIVEEVAYTHKNGILPHRQSADKRMSYIKSHNLDLYGALLLFVSSGLYFITFIFKQFLTLLRFIQPSSEKIKKL
ncbi:MAG: hypothetical protein EXX96DRAFT_507204 [Benjaminiella poitrasii]|nr:MAG: hypothetical protein EXX96DRAFT_507204 [Benjaminiella poitrasii]